MAQGETKLLYPGLTGFYEKMLPIAATLVRIIVGIMFLMHVSTKFKLGADAVAANIFAKNGVGDEVGKVGGRNRLRYDAEARQARLQFRIGEPGIDCLVQRVDDVGRRVLRRADAEPSCNLNPARSTKNRFSINRLTVLHGRLRRRFDGGYQSASVGTTTTNKSHILSNISS